VGVLTGAELREGARQAAADGWPVVELVPGSKATRPGGRGVYDTLTDPAEVERVWTARPDANIGGALGYGFIALDVDPAEGSAETLAKLAADGRELPRTRTHRSAHGGEHPVYRAPTGTRGGQLGDGVMVRGYGSYIVLPPSVLADGGRYEVADDHPPVEAPAWLLERLAIHAGPDVDLPPEVPVTRLPRHLARLLGDGPTEDRSGQLYQLLAVALEMGLDDGEAVYLARRFPPAADKYVNRLDAEIARALGKLRAQHHHPGQPCDRAGCSGAPRWMGAAVDIDAEDFWSARQELARIRAFARARRASPWATLAAVLARVVAATPPSVVLPPLFGGEVSLNLFGALVGPPGAGKDAALAAAAEALAMPADSFVEATPGSGEGLAHLFARRVKGSARSSAILRRCC
jgi:hypothetical protein